MEIRSSSTFITRRNICFFRSKKISPKQKYYWTINARATRGWTCAWQLARSTMQIVVYKQPPVLSSPNTSPDKLDFSKLLHEAARRKGTSCDRRRVCKIAESAVSGSNRGTAPQGSRTAEKNISLARSETDIGARLMLWNEKKMATKKR